MIYTFNEVEINTETRTLSVMNEAQKVQPKVFDLIVFLMENRERALSKEEIQNTIWSNVEVSETAMTRAIMKARKLLKDQGNVIKTVHGHGYHFIAEVVCSENKAAITPHHQATLENTTTNKKVILMTGLALVAVLISVWLLLRKPQINPKDITVAVLPVIDQTQEEDLAWVSMGLMSLAIEMIKADHSVSTVSGRKTAEVNISEFPDDLNLSETTLTQLKDELEYTHLLLIKLNKADGLYQLTHKVYHPKGQGTFDILHGDNPTALIQKMTREFIAALPNKSNMPPYRSISEKVFTNELYSRGMGYQLMGDAKKAREYFQMAVNEDSTLFWPRYELALTTRKLGLAKESEQELLQLKSELPELTDEPAAALVLANALGSAKMRQGDNESARQYYQEGYEGAVKHQRFDYQSVLAGNVALMYKRMNQLDKAKVWVGRAIEAQNQLDDEPSGYPNYLLGQIEYLQGNNETALKHFNLAINQYEHSNQQRMLASTLANKAMVFERLGQWQKAEEIYRQANSIKEEMSDFFGLIVGNLSMIKLHIKRGNYKEAEALFNPTIKMMDDLGRLSSMEKHITRLKIEWAYKQKRHQEVTQLLSKLPSNDFNTTVTLISLQNQFHNGQPQSLNQWLKKHVEKDSSEIKTSERMMAIELQLTQITHLNQDPTELLHKKIDIASKAGDIATAVKAQLQLAEVFIKNGHWDKVDELLQLISLHSLDWWQIKWFKAQLLHSQGQSDQALSLATEAKNSASENWSEENEKYFLSIIH